MTMIKNLLTTTQDGENRKKIGFLYNIGCNMEKGINKVRIPCCLPTKVATIRLIQVHLAKFI
jgi:hypothetical protein